MNHKWMSQLPLLLAVIVSGSANAAIKIQDWGKGPEAEQAKLITLESSSLRVQLTNYGARIVSVEAPDKTGKRADVVLGHANLQQYIDDPKDYFGAIVGRYGNRIAKGTFSIDGQTYHVPPNNNGNALHGGPDGFSRKMWSVITGTDSAEFTLISPDGDMGFPGMLAVHVRYSLHGNRLDIEYSAQTTKTTVVNLTNHAYFNLAGEASGDVLQQRLRLDANRYTPVGDTLIPEGNLPEVAGTPFDFRKLTAIGERIGADDTQLKRAGGYDHNLVLNGRLGVLHEAAFAEERVSGRTLIVLTTEPGVQFYSGNFLNGSVTGYSGLAYQQHAGFCLETQHFPDSPNHPSFPSTLLKPGETFRSHTALIFGVSNGAR